MIRISRRLERLEQRAEAEARGRDPITVRIRYVDAEKGVTSVLVIEPRKPPIEVPPTPEDVEAVRADLEQRRADYRNKFGSTSNPSP